MNNQIQKVKTPEEEELEIKREELNRLSKILADRELELAEITNELLFFERKYYSTVGIKYVELDELKARMAEKRFVNNPADQDAREEAREYRQKAEETKSEFDGLDDFEEISEDYKPTEELRKAYRQIALEIHPDHAKNDSDRTIREKLMKDANEAYSKGDLEKLKKILREYQSSAESIEGEGTGAELVRTIRNISKMRIRIEEIDAEISQFKETDMFMLMNKVNEASEKGRDLLTELALKVEKEIETAKEELDNSLII